MVCPSPVTNHPAAVGGPDGEEQPPGGASFSVIDILPFVVPDWDIESAVGVLGLRPGEFP